MPILVLLLFTAAPKVQDPETVLHKFDQIAFKNMDLSIRNLNTIEVTRKFSTGQKVEIKSYGWWNVSNRQQETGIKIAWRFK